MVEKQENSKAKISEQWDTVAEMLGIKTKAFLGGVEHCEFTVNKLSVFLDIGFIMPEHKCNDSPTAEVFYEFGKRAEAYGASVEYIGFLESKARGDARLIIEGIRVTTFPDSADLILDFSQIFHNADEFTANTELLRAWYD